MLGVEGLGVGVGGWRLEVGVWVCGMWGLGCGECWVEDPGFRVLGLRCERSGVVVKVPGQRCQPNREGFTVQEFHTTAQGSTMRDS